MSKPENPSAFPYPEARDPDGRGIREAAYGMTLRDWFAGQALANPMICTGKAENWDYDRWFGPSRTGIMRHEIVARQALDYADGMLAARGNIDRVPA